MAENSSHNNFTQLIYKHICEYPCHSCQVWESTSQEIKK